ncbi:MAG: hypothetical protein OXC44_04455 [Proteobacteria bacterium]|nr:hypothetical protein [Pseudomonadota bacterium]
MNPTSSTSNRTFITIASLAMTFLLTAIVVSSCRVTTPQDTIQEPTTSELNGVKDKFYHFLLAPSSADPNLYSFYTCHAWGELAPINPIEECVLAYRSKDMRPFTVPKFVIENSTIARISLQGKLNRLRMLGETQSVINVAALTGITLFTVKLATSAVKIALGVAILGGIGGGAMIFISKEEAERWGLDKDAIREEFQKRFEESKQAVGETTSKVTQTIAEKMQESNLYHLNQPSALQFEVWGNTRTSAATLFQDLINDDPDHVNEIRARIPYILPVFARLMRSSQWANKDQLAYHCLPKTSMNRRAELQSMCLPIKEPWPAGTSLQYKRPANHAKQQYQRTPAHEHPLQQFTRDNISPDPNFQGDVPQGQKPFCLLGILCKDDEGSQEETP